MDEELCPLFRIPHRSAGGTKGASSHASRTFCRRRSEGPRSPSCCCATNRAIKNPVAKENPSVVVNEVTARIGRGGLCAIRVLDHTFVCCLMDRCGRQNEGGEGRTNRLSADRGTTQFEMDHYKECWPVWILSNGAALMLICPFDIRDLVLQKREAQKIRPY